MGQEVDLFDIYLLTALGIKMAESSIKKTYSFTIHILITLTFYLTFCQLKKIFIERLQEFESTEERQPHLYIPY